MELRSVKCLKFTFNRKLSISGQIVAQIEDLICSDLLKTGDVLPSAAKIAEEHQISVREVETALRVLRTRFSVTIQPNPAVKGIHHHVVR